MRKGFGTRALHAGKDKGERGHNTPICPSASWEIRTEKELEAGLSGKLPIYHRYGGNPTISYVERKISDLEGGAETRLLASGMAAVNMVVHGAMKSGDHAIFIGPMYGGTYDTIQRLRRREGYNFTLLAATDPDLPQKVYSAIFERTALIWGEITTNPTLATWDVPGIKEVLDRRFLELKQQRPVSVAQEAAIAKWRKPILGVDPSFTGPYNFRAFEHGADVIGNSDTKYRGGHGAFVLGSVTVSEQLLEENPDFWREANQWAVEVGPVPDPHPARLLGWFLEDIHVRAPVHNRNANIVARFFECHPAVLSVSYPGLRKDKNDLQYDIARKLLVTPNGDNGYGGMVTFRLEGGLDAVKRFLFAPRNSGSVIVHKASLGYTKTICESPVLLSQHSMLPADKELFGITDDLIRLSVGLEDIEDILADLKYRLKRSQR